LYPIKGFLAVVLSLGDQHTIDASARIMSTVSYHADKKSRTTSRCPLFSKINGRTGAEDQEKIYIGTMRNAI